MKKNLLLATVSLFLINGALLFGQQNPADKNMNLTSSGKLNSKQVLLVFQDENTDLFGYKDSVTDKIVIQAKYSAANKFSEGLAAVNIGGSYEYDEYDDENFSGGKWGYINTSGVVVIPMKYSAASDFYNGVGIIEDYSETDSTYLYGMINSKGVPLTPIVYSRIEYEDGGYYSVKKNGLWGFVSKTGKEIVPCKYDGILYSNAFLIVTLNEKQGLLDLTGKEIIPVINKNVFLCDENGFFWILVDDNKKYYYHKSGLKLDTKTDFKNGVAIVSLNKKYGLIDKNVHFVLPYKYDNIENFYNGFAIVSLNGKCGQINSKGVEKVPCKYDKVFLLEKGRTLALRDNKQGYVDTLGIEIVPVKYDEIYGFNDNIIIVKLNGKFGLVDLQSGTELISPKYDLLTKLKGDYAKSNNGGTPNADNIVIDGKWGLVSSSGKEIIPPKYNYIYDYVEDMALVVNEGTYDPVKKNFVNAKYGYINKNGEEVIPAIYSEAGQFNNGLATVTLNGESMRITKTGEKYINEYNNICEAIYANDNDAIRQMVKNGADLNVYYKYKIKNQFGDEQSYPIHVLFYYGSGNKDIYEIFKLFLDNGLDIKNDDLINKIIYSCYLKKDRIRMMQLLLTKNINVNEQDYEGTTVIKRLCQFNCNCDDDYEIAKLLLEHGADPTIKDKKGTNAIKAAKEHNCDQLINLLKK
jgi:uncharacterized protein YqkB